MDQDPDLHDPSGRLRRGVGGASAGPWHQTQPGPMDPMRREVKRTQRELIMWKGEKLKLSFFPHYGGDLKHFSDLEVVDRGYTQNASSGKYYEQWEEDDEKKLCYQDIYYICYCLLPWPCWCARPLFLSFSFCFMDCGNLDRGPCLLLIIHTYCHIHWVCVHMTIASVHPGRGILLCCSPEGFFTFFPVKDLFLIRCEVKGQGCHMCTDSKALWGKFETCNFGLYKIN